MRDGGTLVCFVATNVFLWLERELCPCRSMFHVLCDSLRPLPKAHGSFYCMLVNPLLTTYCLLCPPLPSLSLSPCWSPPPPSPSLFLFPLPFCMPFLFFFTLVLHFLCPPPHYAGELLCIRFSFSSSLRVLAFCVLFLGIFFWILPVWRVSSIGHGTSDRGALRLGFGGDGCMYGIRIPPVQKQLAWLRRNDCGSAACLLTAAAEQGHHRVVRAAAAQEVQGSQRCRRERDQRFGRRHPRPPAPGGLRQLLGERTKIRNRHLAAAKTKDVSGVLPDEEARRLLCLGSGWARGRRGPSVSIGG